MIKIENPQTIPPTLLGQLLDACDEVIESSGRMRSKPLAHEFDVGRLCEVMAKIAEIPQARQLKKRGRR